jgi:hypothetical protein
MKRRKQPKQPFDWSILAVPASVAAFLLFVVWLMGIHHDCTAKPPIDNDVVDLKCEPIVGVEKKKPDASTADLLNHLERTGHYRP